MKIELRRSADALHTIATDEKGNEVTIYLPEIAGGAATGIRPMQLLIMGMGGCAASDILMILKKQRQQVAGFNIDIDAEREPGKEPSLWEKAHLVFRFSGKVDKSKAEYAVRLSMEKYCSATETLRRSGTELSWEVRVETD